MLKMSSLKNIADIRNKIALSSNYDKRIQTSNGNETYPYGTKCF